MGAWLRGRLRLLADWRRVAELVAGIARGLDPSCRVYVFGSAVEGRLTAASDIDVLVVTAGDAARLYLELSLKLWEALGSHADVVDLHVAHVDEASGPPYTWWMRRAVPI